MAAIVVATVALGRWVAGGTFGYALFAIIWAPVASVLATRSTPSPGRTIATSVGIGMLIAIPWWLDSSWATAGQATLIMVLAAVAVVEVGELLRRCDVPHAIADTLAATLWLTWIALPIVRPEPVGRLIGDSGAAWTIGVNPVIALNASDPSASDWTHQPIAYRTLTPLGQDVAFDWPASAGPCLISLAVVGGLARTVQRIVPRGTNRAKR